VEPTYFRACTTRKLGYSAQFQSSGWILRASSAPRKSLTKLDFLKNEAVFVLVLLFRRITMIQCKHFKNPYIIAANSLFHRGPWFQIIPSRGKIEGSVNGKKRPTGYRSDLSFFTILLVSRWKRKNDQRNREILIVVVYFYIHQSEPYELQGSFFFLDSPKAFPRNST
jgi:hypothetical protein